MMGRSKEEAWEEVTIISKRNKRNHKKRSRTKECARKEE